MPQAGPVSAALLVARLQAGSRQHALDEALVEYGKLLRTLHARRWFTDEALPASVASSTVARSSATYAGSSSSPIEAPSATPHQTTQATAHVPHSGRQRLHPVQYRLHQDAIDARRTAGHEVSKQTIAHSSPAIFEVIYPYGTLRAHRSID